MARALLIDIITMIFVSLPPVNLRKISLYIVGLVCLSSVACFADSNLLTVAATPYDRQMARINPVLSSTAAVRKSDLTLALVNQWMGSLRSIPYGFSAEWKTPNEVQAGAVADCKGKAVALYQKMHAAGAENLRLVIGKLAPVSRARSLPTLCSPEIRARELPSPQDAQPF